MSEKYYIGEIVSLNAEQILEKFKIGEFPDKTFSKLYARWLGIPTRPGLVLEVHYGKIHRCYCISEETEDFLNSYDRYVLIYDFRVNFNNLQQWMKEREVRPKPRRCGKRDVLQQIEKSVEEGFTFSDHFFLSIVPHAQRYPFVASTINDGFTYIEYSDHFEASHGSRNTKLCSLREKEFIYNETELPCSCLTEIDSITRIFAKLIGCNTLCEFFIIDNKPCLIAAQKRSGKKILLCIPNGEMKIISHGAICGTVKWVDNMSISDTCEKFSQAKNEYVFLAEKPHSEFVDLLKFAKGFIFVEGSVLCHLSILLREKEIPARIYNRALEYKDGEKILLD